MDLITSFANSRLASSSSRRPLSRQAARAEPASLADLTPLRPQAGGIYLYANQQGCDGDRLYYDGCSFICLNGKVIAQGSQFSLNDIEVVTATVDIQEVRAHRSSSSRSIQASRTPPFERVRAETRLSSDKAGDLVEWEITKAGEFKYHTPEEEIA